MIFIITIWPIAQARGITTSRGSRPRKRPTRWRNTGARGRSYWSIAPTSSWKGLRSGTRPAGRSDLVFGEQVVLRGLTINNPMESPTTDAMDIESCRNVHIDNCTMGAGDDLVTIKSGADGLGGGASKPCENVTVTNCTMLHGHGAIVIGSETSGGARNISGFKLRLPGDGSRLPAEDPARPRRRGGRVGGQQYRDGRRLRAVPDHHVLRSRYHAGIHAHQASHSGGGRAAGYRRHAGLAKPLV